MQGHDHLAAADWGPRSSRASSQHVQQFRGAHAGLGLAGSWAKRPKVVFPPLDPSHC